MKYSMFLFASASIFTLLANDTSFAMNEDDDARSYSIVQSPDSDSDEASQRRLVTRTHSRPPFSMITANEVGATPSTLGALTAAEIDLDVPDEGSASSAAEECRAGPSEPAVRYPVMRTNVSHSSRSSQVSTASTVRTVDLENFTSDNKRKIARMLLKVIDKKNKSALVVNNNDEENVFIQLRNARDFNKFCKNKALSKTLRTLYPNVIWDQNTLTIPWSILDDAQIQRFMRIFNASVEEFSSPQGQAAYERELVEQRAREAAPAPVAAPQPRAAAAVVQPVVVAAAPVAAAPVAAPQPRAAAAVAQPVAVAAAPVAAPQPRAAAAVAQPVAVAAAPVAAPQPRAAAAVVQPAVVAAAPVAAPQPQAPQPQLPVVAPVVAPPQPQSSPPAKHKAQRAWDKHVRRKHKRK